MASWHDDHSRVIQAEGPDESCCASTRRKGRDGDNLVPTRQRDAAHCNCEPGLPESEGRQSVTLPGWPSRSPDLSPIENFWAILQKRVSEWGPTTREALEQFVTHEFYAVPQETVDNLVESFDARIDSV